MADLKDQAPFETLDVRGKALPFPLYLTKKKMAVAENGQILRILCDAPGSAEESIPHYAEKMGYSFEAVKLADRWELFIKKI